MFEQQYVDDMPEDKSGLESEISGKTIKADRPAPILPEIEVFPYKRRMDPNEAIDMLIDGHYVLIVDFYSSGLSVLNALKNQLKSKHPGQSFQSQRDYRSAFRELSHRLLLYVNNNKLAVRKAPQIGWLKKLYPDIQEFLLPFPQVQGLNSSWQWYEKGISIPDLHEKIHPFYGVYFPTRFEHLKLFDKWLKKYQGEKASAIDIGIGCGVLTFQLLKHGFEKVYGTDSNQNAIIGLNEYLQLSKLPLNIDLFHGNLFAGCGITTELIVFNPPWLPASQNSEGLDKAIYYDESLFPHFFADAIKYLKPGGRLVLLFSNLAQITDASETHPIEAELSSGGRFEKELFIQSKVYPASINTRRNQSWREDEMVELWVLKKVNG
jgi:hypothetical protein